MSIPKTFVSFINFSMVFSKISLLKEICRACEIEERLKSSLSRDIFRNAQKLVSKYILISLGSFQYHIQMAISRFLLFLTTNQSSYF